MADRVIWHIGTPKSGTTYLQTLLWTHRARLREQGVLVPGGQPVDYNRAAKALRSRRRGEGPAWSAWQRLVEQARSWPGTVVMSNEWFCLVGEALVRRAVDELAPQDVHVVVTARPYQSLVPAAWQETLKLGSGVPLDRFVADLDRPGERWSWWALDPARVLARWAPCVPGDRVHVVTVPPRGSDPDLLWKRFAAVCGIDPTVVDTTQAHPNESLAVESAALLQRLGPEVRRGIGFDDLHWTEQYRWLRRHLGHDLLVPVAGRRIALRERDRERVARLAADSVDEMRRAGYHVEGDLAELLAPAPEGVHPDTVTAEAMLDVAVPVVANLLAEVRERTLDLERAVEERSRDRSSAAPVPRGREPDPGRVYLLMATAAGKGGVARTVMNLADELSKDRHVEIISVVRNADEPTYPTSRPVPITWVVDNRRVGRRRVRPATDPSADSRDRELDGLPSVLGAPDPFLSALTDARLQDLLGSLEPGVLVSTRPSLHAAAVRWAPPYLLTVGQEHLNFVTRSENPKVFSYIADNVRSLDAFVTLTEADKRDWSRALADAPVLVEAIPNALSWDIGRAAPQRRKVVVAAGRFEPRKGFRRLVEAYAPLARERPDWQLHIYGDGEEREPVRARIEELGIGGNVRLMGYTNELRTVFQESSVFAAAPHFEGLPMVLLEAMSQELPMVCMDCPRGPAEVIVDGVNGRLVPDGDLPAFTEALRQVMDDDGLRAGMGAAARDMARRYEVGAVADRWRRLFEDLLARRRGRRPEPSPSP